MSILGFARTILEQGSLSKLSILRWSVWVSSLSLWSFPNLGFLCCKKTPGLYVYEWRLFTGARFSFDTWCDSETIYMLSSQRVSVILYQKMMIMLSVHHSVAPLTINLSPQGFSCTRRCIWFPFYISVSQYTRLFPHRNTQTRCISNHSAHLSSLVEPAGPEINGAKLLILFNLYAGQPRLPTRWLAKPAASMMCWPIPMQESGVLLAN